MRFIFYSLFLILFISTISVITLDTFTGAIVNDADCPGGTTYAFCRLPEECNRVAEAWLNSGHWPVAQVETHQGMTYCFRRMTAEEKEQALIRKQYAGQPMNFPRERIVSQRNSI
ncbi:hypothetical protein COV18_02010 [Candidatus Woesearchaeota archaeon CG10_big_fil_rev_8_21_14_0_10_37_12]|nr:MAG: hypothetical protein COV18_02010 [Candidatus Woesearchaeota archaeon CG10_big_fil_rev_8_21_14_0_10_37_12]